MKKFALKTLILTMSAVAVTAHAGYVNSALSNSDFQDTLWENGITPNSTGNPHVVDNIYAQDGSDTDPNRVTVTDAYGNEATVSGVNSGIVTGFSNTLTDVAPVSVYGVKNELSNLSTSNVIGLSNTVNGLEGGGVYGVWNNVATKHGDKSRSVFVVGSYNEIKSAANAVGRNIEIGENSAGANVIGNHANIAAENAVALGDNTSVTAANSVAIGKGSIAGKANTVSFGSAGNERQITNVKAGTADTDAVNLKQLKDEFAKVKSVDVSGKADKSYVDSQNQAQDSKITANTTKNTQQDSRLSAVEAKNTAQDTAIAGKADKSAVDSKNAEQDKKIAANTSKNTAQDTAISNNTKAIDGLNKSQDKQDKLIAGKADTGYVDSVVSSAVSGLASTYYVDNAVSSAVSTKADKSELEDLSLKLTSEVLRLDIANIAQDEKIQNLDTKIAQNSQAIDGLTNRVERLDRSLSGGIAGSVAIGMMPTATEAGVRMVSGAFGHHNGETAVAIGFTGATGDGKYFFKVGSSYATSGGATFGGGVGYRF